MHKQYACVFPPNPSMIDGLSAQDDGTRADGTVCFPGSRLSDRETEAHRPMATVLSHSTTVSHAPSRLASANRGSASRARRSGLDVCQRNLTRSQAFASRRAGLVATRASSSDIARNGKSAANGVEAGESKLGAAPTTTTVNSGANLMDEEFAGLEGTEWFSRSFEERGRKFSEVFPVRYAEVGPNGEATMVTIADLIQECACNHAQGIWGVGQSMPAAMNQANLAWVCTRLHLRVRKYPKWGEKVSVSTWFEPQGKIAARRDYAFEDHQTGEKLGEATSQWVVFNLGSRRMARIPNSVLEDFKFQALEQQVMEEGYAADKLPDVDEVGSVCGAPIVHSVRRSDMDMNGHVNNVVYVQWLLESVPSETWDAHVLSEVILEYRSECNFGDSVKATCCEIVEEGEAFVLLHKLARGEGEIVRAKTVWQKK